MADESVILNPGAGGAAIAVDTIAGISHELVKIEYGDDGSATQVSPTHPLPVTDASTQALLNAIGVLLAGQATAANQSTEISALAAILGKIIAAPSTEAKQDVIISSLASIDAGTAAALGQALMAASVPVVIASDQSTIPVTAASLPLPSGAATAARQDAQTADLDLIAASASVLDDWDETDRAKVNLIAGQAGIDGGSGASSAKTPRVILATDQAAIPVTFSGLATDNTTVYSNTIVAAGAIAGFLTTGYASISAQLSGTWTGNIVFEGSNDNSTWYQLFVLNSDELTIQDVLTTNGNYYIKTTTKYLRINVLQLQGGSIVALMVGRTISDLNAADILSLAMDKGNGSPLYVSEVDTKKDVYKALIPSDAPVSYYGWAQGTNNELFKVDTTGYQCVVVQIITFGSTVTMQHSNDGVTWYSLLGYNGLQTSQSIFITALGMYEYAASGRYVRGVMSGAVFTNCIVYLRQRPANPYNTSTGGGVNIIGLSGFTPVTAGINGVLAIGGPVAVGNSVAANNPVQIAGVDSSLLLRRIFTDSSGRVITAGVVDPGGTTRQAGALGPASNPYNLAAQMVMDVSQYEGQNVIEILAQILVELKINNQMMNELPVVLQGASSKFDELNTYRNDSSLLAV